MQGYGSNLLCALVTSFALSLLNSFAPRLCVDMPVIKEVVRPESLDFKNQKKVMVLRDVEKLSFNEIAERVVNLKGEESTEDTVRRVYNRFSPRLGRVRYHFNRCGRKAWKITPDVSTWLIRRLLSQRRKYICTSTSLQCDLATEKGISLSTAAIRKHLTKKGYKWLPRSQKRKYSKEDRKTRLVFAKKLATKSDAELKQFLTLCMDGVVIPMAPTSPIERENFCMNGESHMWRKRGEAALPELSGEDPYAEQCPLARCLPLWAGISSKGVAEILFHKTKKVNKEEWVKAGGSLAAAVKKLKCSRSGPYRLLCDNEGFLDAKIAKKMYKRHRIEMLHVPPRSPDLNPIERFWAWLRKQLRRKDLADLRAGRPALGKMAFKVRVRALLKTKKAQNAAKSQWVSLKKVCKEVVRKKGAASRS